MRPPTDKIVAAVRFEGVVEDEDGSIIDGAIDKLESLRADDRYIVLVSPKTQTVLGKNALMHAIVFAGVPYDEVWEGHGIPEADEWYDNNAQKI